MVEGVYIHIPFCDSKCPYCDFFSVTDPESISTEEYIDCLLREIDLYLNEFTFKVRTLYLGGGTPSKLKPEQIASIINKIRTLNGDIEEITVECNPESYSYDEFRKLFDNGVTRLSFGVQTFSEKGLKILGRNHSSKTSITAIENAFKSGFKNINADIIYGYPSQEINDLLEDIKILSNLPLTHISAYILTLYENTPMSKKYKGFKQDENLLRDMHTTLSLKLKELGFNRYEISNWAKEGYLCKHNLLYWTGGHFIGIGTSSWSYVNGRRWSNVRNINVYVERLKKGKKPVEVVVDLKPEDLFTEYIILRLRTMRGARSDIVRVPEHISEFFEFENGHVRIKEEFFIVANELISEVLCYNKPPREELCWKLKDLRH